MSNAESFASQNPKTIEHFIASPNAASCMSIASYLSNRLGEHTHVNTCRCDDLGFPFTLPVASADMIVTQMGSRTWASEVSIMNLPAWFAHSKNHLQQTQDSNIDLLIEGEPGAVQIDVFPAESAIESSEAVSPSFRSNTRGLFSGVAFSSPL
jgi:hypothetical protein